MTSHLLAIDKAFSQLSEAEHEQLHRFILELLTLAVEERTSGREARARHLLGTVSRIWRPLTV
jgi:hypothetical protein